jgi:hypothetical protein
MYLKQYEEIKYLKESQKIDDKMALLYYQLGSLPEVKSI